MSFAEPQIRRAFLRQPFKSPGQSGAFLQQDVSGQDVAKAMKDVLGLKRIGRVIVSPRRQRPDLAALDTALNAALGQA